MKRRAVSCEWARVVPLPLDVHPELLTLIQEAEPDRVPPVSVHVPGQEALPME